MRNTAVYTEKDLADLRLKGVIDSAEASIITERNSGLSYSYIGKKRGISSTSAFQRCSRVISKIRRHQNLNNYPFALLSVRTVNVLNSLEIITIEQAKKEFKAGRLSKFEGAGTPRNYGKKSYLELAKFLKLEPVAAQKESPIAKLKRENEELRKRIAELEIKRSEE